MSGTRDELIAWLGPRNIDEKIAHAVPLLRSTSERERLLKDDATAPDYGYSFPNFHADAKAMLTAIRKQANETGNRPMVADVGAGLGSMSWKLMAAGATVDAFELQAKSAEELLKRARELHPSLLEGDDLDTRLTVHAGDALTNLNADTFNNKYDFVWMGNVIHFMSPDQIRTLTTRLKNIVKPGGKVMMTSHVLATMSKMLNSSLPQEAIQEEADRGTYCPGFLAMNISRLNPHVTHASKLVVHNLQLF